MLNIDFSKYLFSLFSRYFVENDSYKDNQGKGLLERYMSVYGYEVNEELIPQIENYLNIIDAQICDGKYLMHISDVLGNPPDIFKDDAIYRNLLSYIISVYKIKGTRGAYELFFSILGFGITIEELPLLNNESAYDLGGGIYDQNEYLALYDQNKCQTCSFYDVEFYFLNDSTSTIDSATISKLRSVIYFNEPINARLRNFVSVITLSDEISVNLLDTETNQIETVPVYDVEEDIYEDGLDYDNIFTIGGDPLLTALTLISENESGLVIELHIDNNFTPATIDEINTKVSCKFYNGSGELIGEKNGVLEDIVIDGSDIDATITEGDFNIPQLSYITLKIRMVLSDGRLGYLHKTIGATSNTLTQIYLI